MMKKPIKLIMTDLDGTLLTDDKKVTERTREAIRKVKKQGVLFGIATGRAIEPVQILSKQWQIDDLIDVYIGYNGSQYYDVKEDYYESTDLLPGSCMEEIMDHLRKNNADCEFMIYLSKDFLVYTSGVTPEVERVARNNFFEIRVCDMKEFVRGKEYEKLLATCHKDYMPALMKIADTLPKNGYRVCTSTPNLMEFMDPVVSKTYGIEKVCRHRGFE
ncbi:MAG: HAD family phosphatase, partial [Erysipelotrichaceae bacterium]|nr:HAD family phosphatase [Erysipelotrichaceae bacterium]